MGNSITHGHTIPQPQTWPNLIGPLRGFASVINVGISGQYASDMLARFDRDVIARQPKAVSIMAGTNDAGSNRSVPAFKLTIKTMALKCIAIGARPTLCTPPVNRDEPTQSRLPNYVNAIREVVTELNAQYGPDTVILFDVFARWSTYTSTQLDTFMYDVSHPTVAGHQDIANMAMEPANTLAFTGAA